MVFSFLSLTQNQSTSSVLNQQIILKSTVVHMTEQLDVGIWINNSLYRFVFKMHVTDIQIFEQETVWKKVSNIFIKITSIFEVCQSNVISEMCNLSIGNASTNSIMSKKRSHKNFLTLCSILQIRKYLMAYFTFLPAQSKFCIFFVSLLCSFSAS